MLTIPLSSGNYCQDAVKYHSASLGMTKASIETIASAAGGAETLEHLTSMVVL